MIELATYRYVVLEMVEKLTGLKPATDVHGVPTDENIELCIRRYWLRRDRARDCAQALIIND